jgi:NADPH2:quinone reductase
MEIENEMTRGPRRRFSAEEKARIVRLYEESGLRGAEFCRREGVSLFNLRRWLGRQNRVGEARFVEIEARASAEQLDLKQGEALMILGASGGIGHLAVQLAKRMGARVLAMASGDDGVALATRLGADAVINGRKGDVAAAAREFEPDGLDAALVTAGGETAERALAAVRDGGRVAYPNGVMPEPKARPGVRLSSYDVIPSQEATDKLNRLIDSGPFEIHVARTFPLDQAAEAHRALGTHFLGKLALRPR